MFGVKCFGQPPFPERDALGDGRIVRKVALLLRIGRQVEKPLFAGLRIPEQLLSPVGHELVRAGVLAVHILPALQRAAGAEERCQRAGVHLFRHGTARQIDEGRGEIDQGDRGIAEPARVDFVSRRRLDEQRDGRRALPRADLVAAVVIAEHFPVVGDKEDPSVIRISSRLSA